MEREADEESEIATKVYEEITKHFADYEIHTSGPISDRNNPVLPTWIVVLAIFDLYGFVNSSF